MRSRRIMAATGFIVVATVTASALAIPASATRPEERQAPAEIHAFVDRVEAKYGVSIDSADYELRRNGGETWILRKDAKTPQVTTVRHEGKAESEPDVIEEVVTPGLASPPTPGEAAKMKAAGEVTITQDTAWYQPTCWARLSDPEDAGHMDACAKWGDMNYSGETRQNWAYHMYASCWPGGANFWEVTECFVDTVRDSSSGTLFWNDWSPKGTLDLGGCQSISLGVSAGPVNGGWTHNFCGRIIPDKGSEAADMRTRLDEELYYTDEVREIAQIIGIGAPFGQNVVIQLSYGYSYRPCTPGNPIDWCG